MIQVKCDVCSIIICGFSTNFYLRNSLSLHLNNNCVIHPEVGTVVGLSGLRVNPVFVVRTALVLLIRLVVVVTVLDGPMPLVVDAVAVSGLLVTVVVVVGLGVVVVASTVVVVGSTVVVVGSAVVVVGSFVVVVGSSVVVVGGAAVVRGLRVEPSHNWNAL